MNSYLEGYGEAHVKRAKVIKLLLIAALLAVIVGATLYFKFRDYSLNRTANEFLQTLERSDYKQAYAFWGCTESAPCANYPIEEFMKDWGPKGLYRSAGGTRIVGSKSCEGGLIEFLRIPGQQDTLLWVDRQNGYLSFAPWRLKEIPSGFKHRIQEWMWEVTRNCKPLIGP